MSLIKEIVNSGYLKIGVTGDYAPFSYKNPNSNIYSGIDHEIGYAIAQTMGVRFIEVETSWSTLMDDFLAKKFTLGISGIAKTIEREKTAFFSKSYCTIGKTPITKIENIKKYDTLEKINNSDVKIVVNKGGTNEIFVKKNLKKAKIHMENTNNYVFDRILDNSVDLMITDSIEADYMELQNPKLKRSMPDTTFGFSEISIMMPQDNELKKIINNILEELKKNGKLKNIIAKNMIKNKGI
jgi:cyclohexadienyl dehydratase